MQNDIKYFLDIFDKIQILKKEVDAHIKKFSNLMFSEDFDVEKSSDEIAKLESEMYDLLNQIEELNNKFI